MIAISLSKRFEQAQPLVIDDIDIGPDIRPTITLRAGELHNIATHAERALLLAKIPFYVRGGKLVRPVVDDMPASKGRRTKVARLAEVSADAMIDSLSSTVCWLKFNVRRNADVRTDPPHNVAATILSRDGSWQFERLAGVITTPTLRPDGTILSTAGYDASTQLLLLHPPKMPPIAERPSRNDAGAALKILDELLDEFPFVDAASRSVALSALITPVVRGALTVAPMHVTKAPVAGSGKSYIFDVASAINSGERAPVLTAGRTEEETEKRLVGALLSGQTIVSIDNVNGQLGGDFLCQLIERPIVQVRPLGQSHPIKIDSRSTCFATGNNIQLVGDMTRRVVVCSLDPDMERPELRTFRGKPFDQVLADRGRFVAAALTAVRAYVVAGFPGVLPALASFEDWSCLVRSMLVWLGYTDPVETMQQARDNDPVTATLTVVLGEWYRAVQSASHTSGTIKAVACELDAFGSGTPLRPDFREALMTVADDRRGGISAPRIGNFLAQYAGRIVNGLKLVGDFDTHRKQMMWRVVTAS